ncbi:MULTISPECIES: GDSL-type esterase/lipase family protein [unclassified Cyanobium]|uniref:GDSL-type esterase/lipase family protein n=1 Tax=unclassified Cyanobium TaxID=2627006 RepID=UPI0020CF66F9|nr:MULTISPECIES: GDSL-type esterase/lipase family protein [unclassified Cyanobium]MCP9833274.1 arylesterase [Cyanobium sp. La Preciosa 7G6]MCP9935863.1 arylesterase [Cyanobium sp. Aljojuca 7A6]
MTGPSLQVPRKLVVLGDSGVYGWGDPEQGGWCERLRRHWMDLPQGPVLYGLGVRGDGLERLAARAEAEVSCRGELRRQRPQGILLSIGLNDTARVGRTDGRFQLAPEAFLFGLQQMLPRLQAIAPVFVLGLTPVDEAVMPFAEMLWYDLASVRLYEGLLEEACMEADVPFLPLLDGLLADPHWLQWLCSDGLHLNGDGHGQLYRRLRSWSPLLHWAELDPHSSVTAAL